jgi:AcrR family transcriptional regulator
MSQSSTTVAPRADAVKPVEPALTLARRAFLRTGRLDMGALARDLGIGRATLYRRVGSREALLGEVLLSLYVATLAQAEADVTTPAGPRRICEVQELRNRRMLADPSFRRFLHSEPEVASRVLLHADGAVHQGVTAAFAAFIRRQEAASGWRAPIGAEELASIVVRVSEAFIYADLIAHGEPDTGTPNVVLRLMLGVPLAGQR